VRLVDEQPLLGRLPQVRFDTARRQQRRVGRVPLIEWDGVFYSVPPQVAGSLVEVRAPVDAGIIEIRHAGRLVATHRLDPDAVWVWDPTHRAAAETIALNRHHRPHRAAGNGNGSGNGGEHLRDLGLGDGDLVVDVPDLERLGLIGTISTLDANGGGR